MSQRFDIAVVGAGLAGATAALALARDGWSVALVEGGGGPTPIAAGESPRLRVSTLSPASINILTRLDVWSQLPAERVQAFAAMRVWEADPGLELVFRAADAGLESLGCVVENDVVLEALWQAAQSRLTLLTGTQVAKVVSNDRRVRLSLADGQELQCALLVAADGANSRLRDMLNIDCQQDAYPQVGVVATVQVTEHADTAWQRFLPSGPLAFLPLPDQRCSIVWTCATEAADELLASSDEQFCERLETACQQRLQGISVVGPRASFPLRRLNAAHYQVQRAVLVGDAAHVVHPLAGQGANLGLLDAAALADTLRPLRRTGDPAAPAALRRYARWRRSDNAIMGQSLHQIWRLYARDTPTFRGLRLLGARCLNGLPWLRGRLIAHASGLGGEVPTLAAPLSHNREWGQNMPGSGD